MGCRLADLAKVGEDLVADACTINMHTESVELIATRSPFADERIWCHVNFRLRRRAACSLAVPPAPRRRDRASARASRARSLPRRRSLRAHALKSLFKHELARATFLTSPYTGAQEPMCVLVWNPKAGGRVGLGQQFLDVTCTKLPGSMSRHFQVASEIKTREINSAIGYCLSHPYRMGD